ncbi:MAG TPA: transcriptional repressor LexA [bacterium]|nr:transcriptional repressor LexA [bacterium]
MGERPLTPRQREILDWLRDEIDRRGLPPTIREIGESFGIRSTKGVEDHLAALERKGYIRREKGKSRAIEVADRPDLRGARLVPLVGRIAAGAPVLAVENHEGTFVFDESLVGAGETFLLRVQGDSMTKTGILDSDLVIVRKQDDARNGDIVAARVGDEATVKRFRKGGGRVTLLPENDAYDPIEVDPTEGFEILGKVVGVYRRM